MVAGSLGTLARYGISIFFNKYAVVKFSYRRFCRQHVRVLLIWINLGVI